MCFHGEIGRRRGRGGVVVVWVVREKERERVSHPTCLPVVCWEEEPSSRFDQFDMIMICVLCVSLGIPLTLILLILSQPWLATEIKESRDWDISPSERMDILKMFVQFGHESWGTDQSVWNHGIISWLWWWWCVCGEDRESTWPGDFYWVHREIPNPKSTSKSLINGFISWVEWLSFLHRYVPIGLIEAATLPQRMNQRPPIYVTTTHISPTSHPHLTHISPTSHPHLIPSHPILDIF